MCITFILILIEKKSLLCIIHFYRFLSMYAMQVNQQNEKFNFQLKRKLFFSLSTADIISSSSTESIFNEYDSRHFDDDLRNEIYPAPYNAATAGYTNILTMMSFLLFVTFFLCK